VLFLLLPRLRLGLLEDLVDRSLADLADLGREITQPLPRDRVDTAGERGETGENVRRVLAGFLDLDGDVLRAVAELVDAAAMREAVDPNVAAAVEVQLALAAPIVRPSTGSARVSPW
jgi:hypothetical protein